MFVMLIGSRWREAAPKSAWRPISAFGFGFWDKIRRCNRAPISLKITSELSQDRALEGVQAQ
jgi:hypothetical protein